MSSRNTAHSLHRTATQNQQPLRQRCSVKLSVHTSLASGANKGPVSIARGLVRRMPGWRKNVKVTPPKRMPTPPLIQLESLSWIFTDLSVAYCDFDSSASSTEFAHPLSNEEAEYLRCFTHVIRIIHAKTSSAVGERKVHFDEEHGIHTLSLLIPPARRTCLPRTSTVLTVSQLRAAKDFLNLALPYDSTKFAGADTGDKANVLVTAPKWDSGEVDVMSVVLGYLSFVSYKSVCTIWQEIRSNDCSIGWEWRRGLGEGDGSGLLFIQRVVEWWWGEARKEAAEDRVQNRATRTPNLH